MGGLPALNLELRQVAEGVWATSRAAMQAEVADVMVFDMDGVLIDVRASYPVVICRTVDKYLAEWGLVGDEPAATPQETAYFKAAGGFNSDWLLAQGIILIYLVKANLAGAHEVAGLRAMAPDLPTIARSAAQFGGGLKGLRRALENLIDPVQLELVEEGWDRKRITRLAQEFYAGDLALKVFGVTNDTVRGEGLMLGETPLISRKVLLDAPFRYGLYTGRKYREAQQAITAGDLAGIFSDEAIVTEDRGVRKPDPTGLFTMARVLSPRLMIYAGDNLDDWQAAARYETERTLDGAPCLFCGILGGSPGALSYSLFQDRGVDLVADSVEHMVAWVQARRHRIAENPSGVLDI